MDTTDPMDAAEAALRMGNVGYTIGDVVDATGRFPVYITALGPQAMVGVLFLDPEGRAGGSVFEGAGRWEGFKYAMWGIADRVDAHKKFNDRSYKLGHDLVTWQDAGRPLEMDRVGGRKGRPWSDRR